MKHDFSEKVVLISGGTSGIGLAAARQFVEAGASIVLLGRDAQRGSTSAPVPDTARDGLSPGRCADGYQLTDPPGAALAAARRR